MTTTTDYTWGVAQMERHTADGIVFTVHYTVAANDCSRHAVVKVSR